MFRKRRPQIGARPGTLAIPKRAPEPRIHMITYDPDKLQEGPVTETDDLRQAFDESDVTWIDVQGFGDRSLMHELGDMFELHPLLLEDLVNVPQRPKAEDYGDQLLLVVRMVRLDDEGELDAEQVSIVLAPHYVLTFQEKHGDILDPVRRRLRGGKGIIRQQPASYLAYAIADTIIDGYYPVLDAIGEEIDALDEVVISQPSPELLRRLNDMKNRLVMLRRWLWAQREAVNTLMRDDSELITDELRVFLRDTYSHCVQTAEVAEMYREMITGLMNTYMSAVANRTNEVMKVLTIMASIFIPLTFLAGIYGMNFEHMPELHMKWAYPAVWFTMIATAGGMLVFFWRKGWLGGGP
ncbi:Magnesium transport protein CorA [Posidoniimonas polymericola]|uniref:Magnesium transport protein CorA n=1 Tax=Posidoniimonas polymericola TaxID=2528002 RepID=A0A5C5YQV3_9BACT|nr:magnesium/cobalt transporter CorA [Posidoniimonas polymericola]TWT77243.1 Magnesium transport protein CorA [Posidoniimonas polymericola]